MTNLLFRRSHATSVLYWSIVCGSHCLIIDLKDLHTPPHGTDRQSFVWQPISTHLIRLHEVRDSSSIETQPVHTSSNSRVIFFALFRANVEYL